MNLVLRVYIPKGDGRQRPIGIPALEDKIVQRAVGRVLGVIYEHDFLGFSYGFRPELSPHQGLDVLSVGILMKKVNWVLDADIRGFFETLDQEWLGKFIEHRMADGRIVRLIREWLKAGVCGGRSARAVPTATKCKSSERFGWPENQIVRFLKAISKVATVIKTRLHLHVLADEPDNRILVCAVEAAADFIVTGDKHLLSLKNFQDIRIFSLFTFLKY